MRRLSLLILALLALPTLVQATRPAKTPAFVDLPKDCAVRAEAGDSYWKLAQRYAYWANPDVREWQRLNHRYAPRRIPIGAKLTIPENICTPEFRLYRSKSGHWLLYQSPGGHVYRGESDGKTFFPLYPTSFSGNELESHFSFLDPFSGARGEFNMYSKGDVVVGGVDRLPPLAFYRVKVDYSKLNLDLRPFPDARDIEYIYQDQEGRDFYVLVTAGRYTGGYDSFHLFVGPLRDLQQLPVSHVSRLRDGGTTWVYTPANVFFAPVHSEDGPAKWGKRPLKRLDRQGFKVREVPGQRVILLPVPQPKKP